MHEHLECYDESLIGMCGVLLIMFVLICDLTISLSFLFDISQIKWFIRHFDEARLLGKK